MVEDALFVSAYPIPPYRCTEIFLDYPEDENEDNSDNDYVQSLCFGDHPGNDPNETYESDDTPFPKRPTLNDQNLSEGDIEGNGESEYDDTVEFEREIGEDQQDAVEADASLSEEDMEDSLFTDASSDFGEVLVYQHDISADVLMCSTPMSDDGRGIIHAAINDSVCWAKGEEGEVSYVSSCYVYGSDDDQAYYREGYFRYPTKKNDTMESFGSENSSQSFSAYYDYEPLRSEDE